MPSRPTLPARRPGAFTRRLRAARVRRAPSAGAQDGRPDDGARWGFDLAPGW
jgi:hypothetical protein